MSTYAISDIHGCFDEFQDVLQQVEFGEGDSLYILGDLVDRGPKIGECIQWLCDHDANGKDSNVHFIMGNHEEMADWAFVGQWSDFQFDRLMKRIWSRNGGAKTVRQMQQLDKSVVDHFQRIVTKAPKSMRIRIDDQVIFFCHAGVRPAEPEAEEGEWFIQAEEDLLWIGVDWYASSSQAPFHVVSGHTPTIALCNIVPDYICPDEVRAQGELGQIMNWGHKHCIDCGCVYGGKMGILRLDDWEGFYAPSAFWGK